MSSARSISKIPYGKNQRKMSPSLPITTDVMHCNLFHKMDSKSLAAFANSSLYARQLTQPVLDQRGVKKVFEHIREGEIDKLKKMLDASPQLALKPWKATKAEDNVFANKAGQLIAVEGKTAYEFAIGEEDTEMAVMLRDCIVKVANEELAIRLFNQQRPPRWQEEEAEKSKPILTQLDVLTQAIRQAQPADIISSGDRDYRLTVLEGSTVAKELTQFRSLLDATLKETITTGRHFNPNLLLRAFQIYADHYADYFGNHWSNPKAMLFWQRTIGYIQRCMPVNFVQAFCDGLYNTHKKLEKGDLQARSLRLEIYHSTRNWVPSDFYPLSDYSSLGFDLAIYGLRGGRLAGRAAAGRACEAGSVLRSLCQSKTAGLQSLLSAKSNNDVRYHNRFV